jgi:hypothetical protein
MDDPKSESALEALPELQGERGAGADAKAYCAEMHIARF